VKVLGRPTKKRSGDESTVGEDATIGRHVQEAREANLFGATAEEKRVRTRRDAGAGERRITRVRQLKEEKPFNVRGRI
jgi:hypothetical protein